MVQVQLALAELCFFFYQQTREIFIFAQKKVAIAVFFLSYGLILKKVPQEDLRS